MEWFHNSDIMHRCMHQLRAFGGTHSPFRDYIVPTKNSLQPEPRTIYASAKSFELYCQLSGRGQGSGRQCSISSSVKFRFETAYVREPLASRGSLLMLQVLAILQPSDSD